MTPAGHRYACDWASIEAIRDVSPGLYYLLVGRQPCCGCLIYTRNHSKHCPRWAGKKQPAAQWRATKRKSERLRMEYGIDP